MTITQGWEYIADRAREVHDVVDAHTTISVAGAAQDNVAKKLVIGGTIATGIGAGIVLVTSAIAMAGKVLILGGLISIGIGFARGFREGIKEV